MLTLYHAPQTRSSRILTLLDELGALDDAKIETVSIPRQDGSGGRDPGNPHPEGKVPYLLHDGTGIRESNAIAQYLCELYPDAGLAPKPGTPERGAYLGWMAWYGNVMEPVMVLHILGIDDPRLAGAFRSFAEISQTLETALSDGRPYLLGKTWSVADLIVSSAFLWMPHLAPDVPVVRDWIARCAERPSITRTATQDAEALQAA